MQPADIDRLRSIKTLAQLLAYLRDELDWPIGSDDVEDVTYDYDPAELGFDAKATVRIKEVKQLRPLHASQPWGVFWVNFEKKRLPVVMLRRALGHLVVKKRAAGGRADQKAWRMNDLLFISAYGENDDRAITFAHFSQDQGAQGELPVLKVLGWDDADTVLKLADVHRALTEKLRWPARPADVPEWRRQWSEAFTLRYREVITTTELLVDELARLATGIRDAVLFSVSRETEKGPWRRLLVAFQTTLIRDLTEGSFADVIAQTVSYGLLTARFSAPGAITLRNLVDMVPRTNPFLRELLEHFLSSAGRHGLFDVDEVGIDEVVSLLNRANADAIKHDFGNKNSGEDPVIHFYEHFLGAYNKQLKIQRGVFYTPQSVVSYIVRSVHELLQTEFGLADGLADTATWGEMLNKQPDLKLPPLTDEPAETRVISPDEPFVQILDPATGTATFLVEVIEVIHRTLVAKWGQQRLSAAEQRAAWNAYVPKHLLPRLHAFELMMAPYAIAHMKIGLKLAETGYSFGTDERARIYLTNALEPWVRQLPLVGFDALAHEAAAVNEIKRHKRFTVVIGNPPYSKSSQNQGGWIDEVMEEYKRTVRTAETQIQALSDDYAKFIRLAHFNLEQSRVGVLGLITNNGYLDGPLFRDMRSSMLAFFGGIRIVNLHGDSRKQFAPPEGQADENVFDIQQGVATSILWRNSVAKSESNIAYSEIWGTRRQRYDSLQNQSAIRDSSDALQPTPPFFLFIPVSKKLEAEFNVGWHLYQVFGTGDSAIDNHESYGAGFVTQQDKFAIGFAVESISENVREFLDRNSTDAMLWKKFEFCSTNQWSFDRAKRELKGLDIARLTKRCLYRPFDYRFTVFDRNICTILRKRITYQFDKSNVGLLATRRVTRLPYNNVFITKLYAEYKVASHDRNTIVFPLWIDADSEGGGAGLFASKRRLNLNPALLNEIAKRLRLPQEHRFRLPDGVTPDDILHYVYAVLHSPGYRSRYQEFLKIDFPRIPLTESLGLFRALAQHGGELTALHLLESSKLGQPITEFVGVRHPEVEKISWSRDTVWIDKAQATGFKGVAEDVWNFHIGGYQICEKWLKDRKGRTLSKDDLAHYQRVVLALAETIRLMGEIDQVIESHGGWPGAFNTGSVGPTVEEPKAGGAIVHGAVAGDDHEPVASGNLEKLPLDDGDQASGHTVDDDEAMCAIRRVFAVSGMLDREAAIEAVASDLGHGAVTPGIREELDDAIRRAVRRGVLTSERGKIAPGPSSLGDHDRDFLKDQFIASLRGRAWTERDDAIRAFARWMGFRRTGASIDEVSRSLINGLIRDGRLEGGGSSIRRT